MSPRKAALSLLLGVFEKTEYCRWIGPKIFDVWGLPENKPLKTCKEDEIRKIAAVAEDIYSFLSKRRDGNE